MGIFRSINISASGLTAQRLRLDIISNNMANVNTTRTERGGAYRRQRPIFQEKSAKTFDTYLTNAKYGKSIRGEGVKVVAIEEDPSPFKLKFDPTHPDADEQGYVSMPNVNTVNEMVDMISALRSYEANVQAINSSKSMIQRALEIGR